MKEVGREDWLTNPLTVSMTTNDGVSERNYLSNRVLNLSHLVLLVWLSYSP